MISDGARYLPGFLDGAAQLALLADIRRVIASAPFYTPTMPRFGRPFSVRMTNCGPLGWVSDSGLLAWLERDLGAIQASHAITEPAHYIEPASTAHDAVEALAAPGVSHLLVSPVAGGTPHGVVAPLDLVELVTRPS